MQKLKAEFPDIKVRIIDNGPVDSKGHFEKLSYAD